MRKKNSISQTIRTDVSEMQDTIDAIRRNFELTENRITDLESRLDKVRWAVSESSGHYSKDYALGYTDRILTRPDNLIVQLDCSGKNPVLIMLMQQTEVVSSGTSSGSSVGGISVTAPGGPLLNYESAQAMAYFFIGNRTKSKFVHGTIIGFNDPDFQLGATDYPINRTYITSPIQICGVDLSPQPGINEYEVLMDAYYLPAQGALQNNLTITVEDCQLFVMELGLR